MFISQELSILFVNKHKPRIKENIGLLVSQDNKKDKKRQNQQLKKIPKKRKANNMNSHVTRNTRYSFGLIVLLFLSVVDNTG